MLGSNARYEYEYEFRGLGFGINMIRQTQKSLDNRGLKT